VEKFAFGIMASGKIEVDAGLLMKAFAERPQQFIVIHVPNADKCNVMVDDDDKLTRTGILAGMVGTRREALFDPNRANATSKSHVVVDSEVLQPKGMMATIEDRMESVENFIKGIADKYAGLLEDLNAKTKDAHGVIKDEKAVCELITCQKSKRKRKKKNETKHEHGISDALLRTSKSQHGIRKMELEESVGHDESLQTTLKSLQAVVEETRAVEVNWMIEVDTSATCKPVKKSHVQTIVDLFDRIIPYIVDPYTVSENGFLTHCDVSKFMVTADVCRQGLMRWCCGNEESGDKGRGQYYDQVEYEVRYEPMWWYFASDTKKTGLHRDSIVQMLRTNGLGKFMKMEVFIKWSSFCLSDPE